MFQSSALLLGWILLAAVIGGSVAHLCRLPRVVGYLLAGIGVKMIAASATADAGDLGNKLQPFGDLALGLILFAVGGVFERSHLRSVGWRVLRISAAEAGITMVLVLTACWAISRSATVGWFMGSMAIATAPAATLLVLREYEAKGPTADHLLTLTGLNNIWSIILFYLVFLVVGALGQTEIAADRSLALDLVLITVGSLGVGIVLGLVLSIVHAAASLTGTVTLFFAILLALGSGIPLLHEHTHLQFNHLLICLAMGATFANEAIHPDRLHNAVAGASGPIFAGFFALAGYNLHFEALKEVGLLGVGYCVMRLVGKVLGCYAGLRWAGGPRKVRPNLGLGLTCQAGVAIGLAAYLSKHLGQMAPGSELTAADVSSVILASVAVFELVGPLLVKSVVVGAGEVKAVSLISRPSVAVAETTQVAGLIVRSFLRVLHFGGKRRDDVGDLRVRHIMRSNVKSLLPGSTLGEVMHFVERSRFHEFPVADRNGKFIGVIDYPDIREMIYDPLMRDLVTAVDLADTSREPAVVDQSLEDLLARFSRLSTGCLPVVDDLESRRLVGIVEQRDLLRALH